MTDAAKTVLAAIGALFLSAGVGMLAEHYGVSPAVGRNLFLSVFALILIWVL